MKKIFLLLTLFISITGFSQIKFFMVKTGTATAAPTAYLYDTFTGTDNSTSLNTGTHIPDVRPSGATYSLSTAGSTWGIISNKAYISSGSTEGRIIIDAGHNDGVLSCDITLTSVTDRTVRGLVFRYASASDYLKVVIAKIATGISRIQLQNQTTSLQLFNYTFVEGQTYNLKVSFIGGTVKVYINDALQFTNTNADLTAHAGTKVGIMASTSGTTNDDGLGRHDNLKFTNE